MKLHFNLFKKVSALQTAPAFFIACRKDNGKMPVGNRGSALVVTAPNFSLGHTAHSQLINLVLLSTGLGYLIYLYQHTGCFTSAHSYWFSGFVQIASRKPIYSPVV